MLHTTSPVRVLFRGTYSNPGDHDPVSFRSGKLVEYVKLMDEQNGDVWDWTLAEHINGEVEVGKLLTLTAEVRVELVAQRSQRGGTYTTTKYKFKIVDAKPAQAPAVKAA